MATATDIRDIIYYWANIPTVQDGRRTIPGTSDKIYSAYQQKGGWEGWAQVELAYLIEQKYGASFIITREDVIYDGNTQRADLLLVDRANPNSRQIIELKCQGYRKDQQYGNRSIVAEVQSDVVKLQQNLKQAFKPARCLAIGIACTQGAVQEIKNNANWTQYGWSGQLCKDTVQGPIFAFWVETNVV